MKRLLSCMSSWVKGLVKVLFKYVSVNYHSFHAAIWQKYGEPSFKRSGKVRLLRKWLSGSQPTITALVQQLIVRKDPRS